MRLPLLLVLSAALVACGSPPPGVDDGRKAPDAATERVDLHDGGPEVPDLADGGSGDEGNTDEGTGDEEPADGGTPEPGPSDGGTPEPGPPDGGSATASALLRPQSPMPCADPAVVSEGGAGQQFYVYCTGMSHVWKTADWEHFSNVRSTVTFHLGGLSAHGQQLGAWWAPGLVYSPALRQYVMWVSVPDARATNTSDGWDTRSLAVLTAGSPTGPWTFRAIALGAAVGQHFIDPFLFIDHDGSRYVYWKQYGGGASSSIMGARVDASWTHVDAASRVEIMNGYGGPGTWEDNVRENPAVWYNAASGRYHLLFSGGHWRDDTYATGHALSACGPLCPGSTTGGWHIVSSGDRGVDQVVQARGDGDFTSGGPGGAVFLGAGRAIVYAAAARSASGDDTRYLMRDSIQWRNHSPYVDTARHRPLGF